MFTCRQERDGTTLISQNHVRNNPSVTLLMLAIRKLFYL